jgi:hypothetical protein
MRLVTTSGVSFTTSQAGPAFHPPSSWTRWGDRFFAAQHVLGMFRRPLTQDPSGGCLDRLSNRLTKILSEARKLRTP